MALNSSLFPIVFEKCSINLWFLSFVTFVAISLMTEYHENIGTYFSPRLGLNFKLDDFNSFRLVASRAYRVPSFYEQYAYHKYWLSANPSIFQTLADNTNAKTLNHGNQRLVQFDQPAVGSCRHLAIGLFLHSTAALGFKF